MIHPIAPSYTYAHAHRPSHMALAHGGTKTSVDTHKLVYSARQLSNPTMPVSTTPGLIKHLISAKTVHAVEGPEFTYGTPIVIVLQEDPASVAPDSQIDVLPEGGGYAAVPWYANAVT